MIEPTGTVTFTVKELLERLDVKLDRLDLKLDTKAEAHHVAELEERVDAMVAWRNRVVGGLAVVLVVGAANAAKLWFGV